MPDNLAEARHNLAVANRIVSYEGIIDAFGHVSMRHPTKPDRYLVSRSRSPEVVEAADIYEYTLDSEPVTPLPQGIRGYGELYRMGGVPANKTGEVMGRIETESNRMGRLVDDLLQLARIDEGREMSMEPVNLTDLAAGALSDMMVLAPERDCGLIPLDPRDEAAGEPAARRVVAGEEEVRG